jgi:20S proteasome subunit beta 7
MTSSSVLNVANANHFDPAVLYRTPAAAPTDLAAAAAAPTTRTQSPAVTGTSVLGVCYDGGVLLAADTLGSYGSLARFLSLSRLRPVGEKCVVGAGGEYSDFQYIHKVLEDHV